MSETVLAHQGRAPRPHDAWAAWGPDPLVLVGLTAAAVALAWAWRRRPSPASRHLPLGALGLLVLAMALASPLDTLAGALASAHMVQHVLLTLVAAPLLALAALGAMVLRASPLTLQRRVARARRWPALASTAHGLRRPVVVWLLHAGTLWIWHGAALYDAAVRSPLIHGLEHAAFLATAVLFWSVVLSTARNGSVSAGTGLLLVFTMALQSVLLAALLTFAPRAWYEAYATTTDAWGLDPLTDQQLAGVIMWVPAGFIYVGAGLALLGRWIRESEGVPTPTLRQAEVRQRRAR